MKLVTRRAAALSVVMTLALVCVFAFSFSGVSAANSVTVTLKPVSGSNANGTGVITDNGDGTITVEIKETGLEPGDHIDHIHTGSCAAQGPVKYPLTNITADATGSGSSTTKVNVSFATVTAGGYYLNVHNLAKAGTSCGDITLSAANAPAATTTAATTTTAAASTTTAATTTSAAATTAAAAATTAASNAPTGVPATGQGAAVESNNGFPVVLALIALLALVALGSGLALSRNRK